MFYDEVVNAVYYIQARVACRPRNAVILGSGGTSQYWLAGCISLVSSVQATAADMTRCAICSGLYCILFTVGGWFFHRKREV